jgi:hypothetical protein
MDGIDDQVCIPHASQYENYVDMAIATAIKPLDNYQENMAILDDDNPDQVNFGPTDYHFYEPDIILVSEGVSYNIYALVSRDKNGYGGYIATVKINKNDGTIVEAPSKNTYLQDYELFETGTCIDPKIAKVPGTNYYVVVYEGPDKEGYAQSIEINPDDGSIISIISHIAFDTTTSCANPDIAPVGIDSSGNY